MAWDLNPGFVGWKVQTKPLNYGGPKTYHYKLTQQC